MKHSIFSMLARLYKKQRVCFLAVLVMFFSLAIYLLTWQHIFGGYEGETAQAALSFFHGEYEVKRAGIVAALMYAPFILFFSLFSPQNIFVNLSVVPLVYSSLTIFFIFYIAWYLSKRKSVAIATSLSIAMASIMWPYTNIGMEYQSMFFITLLLFFLIRFTQGKNSLLPVGIVYALLIGAKSYGIIFGLPVFVFVWIHLRESQQLKQLRSVSLWLRMCGPAVLMIGIMFFLNFYFYGKLSGAYSLSHEFQVWTWWEGIYGIFFSFGKSIFLYSPLLLISIWYSRRLIREYAPVAWFLFLSFFALFLITAPFSYWSDETWGVRKLVPIIPLLHLPLLYFFDTIHKNWKKILLFIFLFSVGIYIQVIGSLYFYGKQLDILYAGDVDTLVSMRYVPQLSHVMINHALFISHIKNTEDILSYSEETWFRWLRPGQKDILLSHAQVPLKDFNTFDVVWFTQEGYRGVFYLLLSVSFVLGSILGLLYYSELRLDQGKK